MAGANWIFTVDRKRPIRQAVCLLLAIGLMMVYGCGSSSDTQTAVRQAESLGLIVKITSPKNGSTVLFDGSGGNDNVTFTFSVSGGVAPFGYTWNVSGAGFQSTASGTVENQEGGETLIVFSNPGSFKVDLTVRDSVGKTAADTIYVTTTYDPNVLVIVAQITSPVQNITVKAGDAVTFSGQGMFGSKPYSHAWDFPGGSPRSSTSPSETVTFSDAGGYTVNFTVTDSNGLSSTDTRVIRVTAEAVPPEPGTPALVATIAFPASGQTLAAGDSTSFTGQASGGSGPYRYTWDFPGGDPRNADDPNPGAVQFDSVGTHTVTFTVTDSEGRIASDTVTITVAGAAVTPLSATITSPAGPITITSVSTAGGAGGDRVALSGIGTGGSPFTGIGVAVAAYRYSWDIAGGTPRTSADPSTSATFAFPGSYTVRFTVTDSAGNTATDSVVITAN